MNATGCGKRTLVEIGMRDSDPAVQMAMNCLVDGAEIRLPDNMVGADAMDPDIEGREVIAGIDQRLIGKNFATIAKACDADLADAADPRAGRLDVDYDEIGWTSGRINERRKEISAV
jgi:hypothetical protein